MTGIDSAFVFWQEVPYEPIYNVYRTYFDRDRNAPLCFVWREGKGRRWTASHDPGGPSVAVGWSREAAVWAFVAAQEQMREVAS